MKRKCIYAVVSLLLLSAGSLRAQSTVTVTRNSGAAYTYTVQADGSLTFDGNYLNIKESATGENHSFNMSDVRKLSFADASSSGIDAVEQTAEPLLYPNPAQGYCVVRGRDNGPQHVTVFSMTGAKMIDTTVENESRLDISNLEVGVYMVKVNNYTTKLVKW